MSGWERLFHAVLFEVLAITLSVVGLVVFTDHPVAELSGTMIVVATIAMVWNFIFNGIFDQFVTGQRELRSWGTRIVHTSIFETGLLFFTVPTIAVILGIGMWEAFILDIGVTIFITCYAMVFNYVYDHVRAIIIKKSETHHTIRSVSTIKDNRYF